MFVEQTVSRGTVIARVDYRIDRSGSDIWTYYGTIATADKLNQSYRLIIYWNRINRAVDIIKI